MFQGGANLYVKIDGTAPKTTLYDGTNTTTIQPPRLQITNGSDLIDIHITDIAGLGTAKFQALTFCQDGTNYTAYFLMTSPVAAS